MTRSYKRIGSVVLSLVLDHLAGPFDAATALLWLGPLLFLAIGGWLAFGRFRRGDGDAEDKA